MRITCSLRRTTKKWKMVRILDPYEAVSFQGAGPSAMLLQSWVPRAEHSPWCAGSIQGLLSDSMSVRLVLHIVHEGESKGIYTSRFAAT